jgi:hypothetical protein
MTRYKRTDNIQTEVVHALRELGATVKVVSSFGKALPDLLVGFKGLNFLLEVKSHKRAKLTRAQKTFFKDWRGQVTVVYSPQEAIELLTTYRQDRLRLYQDKA